MKSLPFPLSDQVRRARWYVLPCNHLILAKSTENLTVWYLTPWLVHSLNYSHTHTRNEHIHWGGKRRGSPPSHYQEHTQCYQLLPDFQGTWEERITGKALLRSWRGAFIKGATLKRTVHLGQETSVHKTKYRYCPHGKNVDQVFRHSTTAHTTHITLQKRTRKRQKAKHLGLLQAGDVPLHVVVRQWSLRWEQFLPS